MHLINRHSEIHKSHRISQNSLACSVTGYRLHRFDAGQGRKFSLRFQTGSRVHPGS